MVLGMNRLKPMLFMIPYLSKQKWRSKLSQESNVKLVLYLVHFVVVVESKLKIHVCKPEVQQTDKTYVYETCQKCLVGYVLACHSLRIQFCLFSLML